ncbi:hypothetical protein BRC83_04965 [Halobacteriales archaeon QS_1_68_17]|nr:MAG: hypothetical protein BRC83_04965 [Halobacteriales archaeon QS_1_68_17]
METWVWIAAYVVGFALLQVLVYRYVRDDEPAVEVEGATSPGERARPPATDRGDRQRTADGEGVRCRNCGATNEQLYRYCRECVTPLQ